MGVRLTQLVPMVGVVEAPQGNFDVYGLKLKQIIVLIGKYRDTIGSLFSPENKDLKYEHLITSAPDLVLDIIAMGAGVDTNSPEDMATVEGLPLGVQLTALAEIWRLTVPEPKKLHQLLLSVIENAQQLGNGLQKLDVKPKDATPDTQQKKDTS